MKRLAPAALMLAFLAPLAAGAAPQPKYKAVAAYLAKTRINTCLGGALVDDENSYGVAMRTDLSAAKSEPDDMRSNRILPLGDAKAAQTPDGAVIAAYDPEHGLFAVAISAMESDDELIAQVAAPPKGFTYLTKDLTHYRTRRGLHIGSTTADVLKVFGAPRRVAEHCGMTHYWYGMPHADINFHVVIAAGRVIALRYASFA